MADTTTEANVRDGAVNTTPISPDRFADYIAQCKEHEDIFALPDDLED